MESTFNKIDDKLRRQSVCNDPLAYPFPNHLGEAHDDPFASVTEELNSIKTLWRGKRNR